LSLLESEKRRCGIFLGAAEARIDGFDHRYVTVVLMHFAGRHVHWLVLGERGKSGRKEKENESQEGQGR